MESDRPDVDETKIRERAYQLWEDEGRPEGRHEHHWFQAVRDLLGHLPFVKGAEHTESDADTKR
jgi:hypothetical protein